MRVWEVAVVLLCAVSVAHADVGVVATGEGARPREIGKHVESWLAKRGFAVVEAPLSSDALDTLINCFTLEDLVCARGVVDARNKADALVFVRVDTAGKNVTLNLYWFAAGNAPVGERRVCEKCEGTAWHAPTDTMLERLVGDAPTVRRGVSDRDADRSGRGGGSGSSRLGPSLLLGAGVALLATGGIFAYYGSLDGPDQKYVYSNATPIGIGLGAVGLGATVGGAIWLWQSGSSSGPVASATRSGGYIGWVSRF
jgi:hypothetical protein